MCAKMYHSLLTLMLREQLSFHIYMCSKMCYSLCLQSRLVNGFGFLRHSFFPANSPRQPHWNQVTGFNSTYNQASPASYGQASPSYPSPCGSRNTPQGSPAPPAAARLPLLHPAEPVSGAAANQQVKSSRLHCGAPLQAPPVPPMPAPLPVPISVAVPVPVPAPPVRVAVDPGVGVVQRVSVITEQSKLPNATDSTQSHNGGEVNTFYNSRQQSVNNQVGNQSGNSDCISSRTSNDFIMQEENNVDYTLSGSFGAGLPEQLTRPISESASVSSIPRTHTSHVSGE